MSTEPTRTNLCCHLNAAGRRCRMTVAPTHDTLCTHHLQQHLPSQPDPELLAAELLDGTGNLNTADRVNALLANTVKQLARKRIDRQDALAIGYLAQLLLNTVPGVQKEYQAIRAVQAKEALRKSYAESRARLRPHQPSSEENLAAPPAARPAVILSEAKDQGLMDLPAHSLPQPSEEVLVGSGSSIDMPKEVLLETVLQKN